MDWGKNNVLAIALGQVLYLWKSENGHVRRLSESHDEDNYPTSVIWSQDARNLAVGYMNSELQIWDAETSKLVNLSSPATLSAFYDQLFWAHRVLIFMFPNAG